MKESTIETLAAWTCDGPAFAAIDELAKQRLRAIEGAMRAAMVDFWALMPEHLYDSELREISIHRLPAMLIGTFREACEAGISPGVWSDDGPLRPEVLREIDQLQNLVSKTIEPYIAIVPDHLVTPALLESEKIVPERFAKALRPWFVRRSHALDLAEAHGKLAMRGGRNC